MKRHMYVLEPETAQEKDDIGALKSAIVYHAAGVYSEFFINGELMKEVAQETLTYLRGKLDVVRTNRFNRDFSGIDIAGALRALGEVGTY
jgi:hypothetical protein